MGWFKSSPSLLKRRTLTKSNSLEYKYKKERKMTKKIQREKKKTSDWHCFFVCLWVILAGYLNAD